MESWLEKHKPLKVSGIRGQGKAVRESLAFMDSWRPGQAALLSGPPGVGKTLTVEAIARERGPELLRLNASDKRSAADIHSALSDASKSRGLFGGGRLILIDEADGISGRERGAVGSIVKVIKGSMFPVFVIANDPWKPKLSSLRSACRHIRFSKVMAPSIEKMLREILESEGIAFEEAALKSLARFAQGDLRSAISDLQMVAQGKTKLESEDLSILGFRERQGNIYSALPVIFHSRRISATRKVLFDMDKDPDEVFWWIESNVHQEIVPERLPEAYDMLSRADIMRSRVHTQQNWRFKAIMSDMMAGISVIKGDTHKPPGFRPYQQPTKIMMLGRTRAKRAMMDSVLRKLGSQLHASRRTVRRDYLPFLSLFSQKGEQGVELEKEDLKLLKG